MRLHVICIGDEILLGHTLNRNLAYLGDKLQEHGYAIEREVCIRDTAEMISRTVREELREADVVITVGGLGPTRDDVTRPVIAEELGVSLHRDQEVEQRIRDYLSQRNVRIPDEAIRTQAMIPENATALRNDNGTAPGLWCAAGNKTLVMLPGPPRELQPMFEASVLPRLRDHLPPEIATATIHTCGIPESRLAEQVQNMLTSYPEVTPAFCARPFQVDIRLTAKAENKEQLEQANNAVRQDLGEAPVFPEGITTVEEALAQELKDKGLTVALAESCTGGGLGAALTEVPGSSAYFNGGVIAYSNAVKHDKLGVSSDTLETYGAVSSETAEEMVRGAQRLFNTDAGIAVSGIAGPSGGTAEKPVGLVYIATAYQNSVQIEEAHFPGNRTNVRQRTITTALNQLRLQVM